MSQDLCINFTYELFQKFSKYFLWLKQFFFLDLGSDKIYNKIPSA